MPGPISIKTLAPKLLIFSIVFTHSTGLCIWDANAYIISASLSFDLPSILWKTGYLEVEKLISSPNAMDDMKLYVQLSKEYKDLEPIIKAYKKYRDLVGNITEAQELLSNSGDVEMKEMAKMELDEHLPRKEKMAK